MAGRERQVGDYGYFLYKTFDLKTFEELGVSEEIRRAIEELGFEHPLPVRTERDGQDGRIRHSRVAAH